MSFEGDPVIITVGLWVLSIDSINVVDMVRNSLYFATGQNFFSVPYSKTLQLGLHLRLCKRLIERILACILLPLSVPLLKAWLLGCLFKTRTSLFIDREELRAEAANVKARDSHIRILGNGLGLACNGGYSGEYH